MNLMFVPVLLLGLVAYALGIKAAGMIMGVPKRLAGALTGILAVPGVLYTLYYLHLFDRWRFFYELRAWPGSELLAAGLGFGAAAVTGILGKSRRHREVLRWVVALGLTLWLLVPYLKPLLDPIALTGLHDEWRDGVCLQSTESSCGPAAAATLLHSVGVNATERELARECFTSFGGTENWHLARALRRRGLTVRYVLTHEQPDRVPTPAIAGVRLWDRHGPGHFLAVLESGDKGLVIGDPRLGRLQQGLDELRHDYWFSGFFMVIRPAAGQ